MSSTTQFSNVQKHPRYRLDTPVDIVTPAAEVVQLPLENISLGGAFIRTMAPPPPGSAIRLRLHSADAAITLGLSGRVVHVIDPGSPRSRTHPAGMGVQFEGLSDQTQQLLEKFVDGLVEAARIERARRSAARFLPPATVVVRDERTVVATLWAQGLDKGALYVESPQSPVFGTRVTIQIGALALHGDVVHVAGGRGFGVQVMDLDPQKIAAVSGFLDGTSSTIDVETVKVVGPPLGKVLAAARRLFTGIDEDDAFGGVGLPVTATETEVKERCDGLIRLFSQPRPDASPPQLARIQAACRAVARIEPTLMARVSALREQAVLATRPAVAIKNQIKELLADAAEQEKRGFRVEARKCLERARDIDPGDPIVARRLASVNEAIDLQKAVDLVKAAEVFVQGVGMTDDAVRNAREAARLTKHRDVRLLAIRVFAKAGVLEDAVLLAEELVDDDAKDVLAHNTLFVLHERAKEWRAAVRVGEALLRLKPDDADIQKRVKRAVAEARKS